MPADTNPNGKIFGGWVMAKMDQAASTICGLAAKNNWAQSHYVTAAADVYKRQFLLCTVAAPGW